MPEQQQNNLSQMGKPITAAFNDAMVALGVQSPPSPIEPKPPGRLNDSLEALRVLTVSLDMSDPSAKIWRSTKEGDPRFTASREFNHVALESVQDNGQVRYSTVSALGRPEDYYIYTGNANRMVPLRVTLMAEDDGWRYDDVVYPAMWLSSLTYPASAEGVDKSVVSAAPPALLITLGGVAFFRAILTSCNVRWTGPWSSERFGQSGGASAEDVGLLPQSAEVDLVFTQVTKFGHGAASHNYSATPWRLGNNPGKV